MALSTIQIYICLLVGGSAGASNQMVAGLSPMTDKKISLLSRKYLSYFTFSNYSWSYTLAKTKSFFLIISISPTSLKAK